MKKLNGVSILVVDDEPNIIEILEEEFVYQGAVVSTAPDGREALKKIMSQKFDILITDWRMPGGDGRFLLEEVQRVKSENLKIFVFSAFSDLDSIQSKKLNVLRVFSKPIELDEMFQEVLKAGG